MCQCLKTIIMHSGVAGVQHEHHGRLSWFVHALRYTAVGWHLWEVQRHMSRVLQSWSCSLLHAGLAWDAMLKMTEVELELLTDIDMYLIVEKGFVEAFPWSQTNIQSQQSLPARLQSKSPQNTSCIWMPTTCMAGPCLSVSQRVILLGCLKKKLLTWMSFCTWQQWHGYILEVDLEYPQTMHDSHSDCPWLRNHESNWRHVISSHMWSEVKN